MAYNQVHIVTEFEQELRIWPLVPCPSHYTTQLTTSRKMRAIWGL